MGCCGQSKEFQGAVLTLEQVNDSIIRQPWRLSAPPDLSSLKDCVEALCHVNGYLHGSERNGKDLDQIASVDFLTAKLTVELCSMMDIRMLRRKDVPRVQEILMIAQSMDGLGSRCSKGKVFQASAVALEKRNSLQREITSEILKDIAALLEATSLSERFLDDAKQILSMLQRAQSHVRDVPDLAPQMIKYATRVADGMVDMVNVLSDADPKSMSALEELSGQLDACVSLLILDQVFLVATSGKARWEPLKPRILQAASARASELVPVKLDLLEAELAKDTGFQHGFLRRAFEELSPWCVELAPEQQERIQKICMKVVERMKEAFDKALSNGSNDNVDKLLTCAKEYDAAINPMKDRPPHFNKLIKELESKKANVTLEDMIGKAKEFIMVQCEEMGTLCEGAKANIRKIPRDKYGDRATAPTWRFKLGSGIFKEYSAENSAEVEKHYQAWLANGSPMDVQQRRCKIKILVDAPMASRKSKREGTSRIQCKYGEKCYQKGEKHRKEFCHPGDQDWNAVGKPATPEKPAEVPRTVSQDSQQPSASAEMFPSGASTVREEEFSLDLQYMTQVNITRRVGLRMIKRMEGQTRIQVATIDYFEKVRDFVQGNETMFTKADLEMRLLDKNRSANMLREVDQVLQSMRPSVHDFMKIAVTIGDTKAIDEIVALLGARAESLGLNETLKELRLNDVLEELRQVYKPLAFETKPSIGLSHQTATKWTLLRILLRHKLLRPRFSLRLSEYKIQEGARRRGYMRCQALLSEYAEDGDFCQRLRKGISEELVNAAQWHRQQGQPDAFDAIVKTAKSLQCEELRILEVVGVWSYDAVTSACGLKYDGLARVIEILDISSTIAKTGGRSADELFAVTELLPKIIGKAIEEICARNLELTSVKLVVSLSAKLDFAKAKFVENFWEQMQPWYDGLALKSSDSQQEQVATVEWAIAFCEQLKVPLPKWMMKKDQFEALRKLQSVLQGEQNEKELREAVVFAKQADYKSEAKLVALYDQVMQKLKVLKRLPSGWEVEDLVGDDVGHQMFKQADLDDPTLVRLFQKFFDDTKASITTRDRVGAVPGGYRVQKVVSVMNAESWGSYLARRDAIAESCKHFSGAAPCSAEVWASWSGRVATESCKEILEQCKVPALESSANEFLMFHGTKPDAADLIAKNHFDMSFACKTGLFGAGLYFAENCSKSDEYVKGDTRDWYPMIVARVTLGRINYCDKLDPIKDPGREKLEASCLRGGYHCVIGDRKKVRGTYREFVIYDHYQVYPHFIVWYTRH